MRILLDACVDPRVVEAFQGWDVVTVFTLGWQTLKDHELVKAAQGRFDVLVTIDKGLAHEHNLQQLSFGIVIVSVLRNRIEHYRPLFGRLREAVGKITPGEVVYVPGK